ncbi:MAG: gliding motility-associated C-terminal domain-containing protein [Prevotellaceae bacterium]|jgi:gliding motility-associated-like protein|nr:gliding motility-associated C-terminal domain-containing protein [Prevotellaceae bacterium]
MKKSTFKHKSLALFACLALLSFSNLPAQTTITQADIITALSGSGLIDIPGDAVISNNIVAQNAGTAKTLTIKASGNITISGNLDLSGVAGNSSTANDITRTQRAGKDGHSLIIEAGGSVTVSGVINTSGGLGISTPAGYKDDRIGGKGGNAGNVSIKSATTLTINSITANGGNGGGSNMEGGSQPVAAPGKAGNITIEAIGNISTTGTIDANAGNTGQNNNPYSDNAVSGVPTSENGGKIQITSGGAVIISGAIIANGGNGTGQATSTLVGINNNRNKASTDGGNGGTVDITSCSNLTVATIIVNGGLAGVPVGAPNASTFWNQAGSGGYGGNVVLTSSNGNVTTTQIQANAANGQDATASMGNPTGTNEGNSAPFNGRADHAGWGGNGGTVRIYALQGTLNINNNIAANAGNGGNNISVGGFCGGSGGSGGNINIKVTAGEENTIRSSLAANRGEKGLDDVTNTYQCVEGQAGSNGTIVVDITPYTPPTLIGQIDVDCDDDGIVVSKTIARDTLNAYLANYTTKPGERWEICLDGSTWNAIAFPFTVTDDNKDDYNGYLRCVYTECGVDVRLESVLIYIPCVPVPPTPEDCPKLPNAIIWGGGQAANQNFLQGDTDIENLTVFNRYGTTVFEGASGKGWNGTYKNKPVEPGNYYYVLKHSCLGEVKGTIRVVKE